MKWERFDFIKYETETDALGNEARTGNFETMHTGRGFITPWTNETLQLAVAQGVEVTRNTRLFKIKYTPTAAEALKNAEAVRVNGNAYKLTVLQDAPPRWIVATGQGWRT